ncbi:hypothetical protein [Flavobacterium gelidilacus]|uniref:hypothetical protein n=1 Tax=Flavobacterium gelidilacus TaxID=206041 RepID=UPI0004118239|nr:hypothetical protein [Flavobacterium gelidilacus]
MLVLLVGCVKDNSAKAKLKTAQEKEVIEKRNLLNTNGMIFPNYAIEFNTDSLETTKKSNNKPHQSTF